MKRASHPIPAAVADRLHSAAIHLLRHVRRADTALGIGPAALSALSVLVFGGARSLTALATAEQVRVPTMSRIVAGLVRAGLAARDPDPLDRRAYRIRPTRRGTAVLRRGRRRRVAVLARLVARLAPRKRDELGRAAELIETTLRVRQPDWPANVQRPGPPFSRDPRRRRRRPSGW